MNRLGMCYGKLNRRDAAIPAYARSIEFDVKSDQATGLLLNAFDALIIAEKPAELLTLVEKVRGKGWALPSSSAEANKYAALYHGFQAMALRMSGKDASDAERRMREFTAKKDFAI